MVLNRNTGILVYFSVSEVIDNAARETLYKMKVFVYANLIIVFSISIMVCKYSLICRVCLAKADHALF